MVSEDLRSASTRGQVECEAQRQDHQEFLDPLRPAVSSCQFPQVQGAAMNQRRVDKLTQAEAITDATGKGNHLLAA